VKPESSLNLLRFRPWFYAAALYNLLWGATNVLFPGLFFDLIGMDRPNYLPLWQVVGMFVLVYAPAYWWAAFALYLHTAAQQRGGWVAFLRGE
jgi:hypothetical protein